MNKKLLFAASARSLTSLIKSRKLGCEELLQYQLEYIRYVNPKLNAIVFERFAAALAEARKKDALLKKNDKGLPKSLSFFG